MDEARDGEIVNQAHPLPPSATRRGQLAGEGAATPSSLPPGGNGASRGRNGAAGAAGGAASGAGALGFGLGTGPAARLGAAYGNGGWAEGTARRREARREEAASEEWIASTRKQVAKLCEVASKPFWQVRRRCAKRRLCMRDDHHRTLSWQVGRVVFSSATKLRPRRGTL